MIAHSAEETRQQNEQWGWGLETTEKWEGGQWTKIERGGGVGNIGEDLYKIGELGPSTNFD